MRSTDGKSILHSAGYDRDRRASRRRQIRHELRQKETQETFPFECPESAATCDCSWHENAREAAASRDEGVDGLHPGDEGQEA